MSQVISIPAPLSSVQMADLLAAQQDEAQVFAQGSAYQRVRAIAYFSRHKLVVDLGAEALAYHVHKVMDYKVDGIKKGDLQICAMGILKLDVLRETDTSAKADANNRINDLRRALEALAHFAGEIVAMTDDEFVIWFVGKGCLDGIYREFRAATATEVEPTRDDDKINAAIDGMIGNPAAVEVDNPKGTTGVKLFVARGEGDKLRLVPLEVSSDFIASLSDRVPDPMSNAPARVLFFREMLMTAAWIVPDGMSNIPKKPLRPGEKVTATTEMLPANHIIRVKDGVFGIAGSRVEDTVVLEVEPRDDESLSRHLAGDWFIDTITRKNMLERLEPTVSAAGITGVSVADAQTKSGLEVRVAFERGKKPEGQLLLKSINRMGSVYTQRVKEFVAGASATMDETERSTFNDRFMSHAVKGREEHAVTIAFSAEAISFQLGMAKPVEVPIVEGHGAETVRVARADFVRAVIGLLRLPLVDDLHFSVDPRGLLRVVGDTPSATYLVYVQLLRKEADPKAQVRERALLERVERDADFVAAA